MKKIILFAFALALFSSCKKESIPGKTYKVKYTMSCTDCEVIYYKDSLQNQQTEYHQNSSWSYTFYGRKGQEVLFLAYNTSSVPQGVTATITLNDSVITTQTNYCPISGDAFVVDTLR